MVGVVLVEFGSDCFDSGFGPHTPWCDIVIDRQVLFVNGFQGSHFLSGTALVLEVVDSFADLLHNARIPHLPDWKGAPVDEVFDSEIFIGEDQFGSQIWVRHCFKHGSFHIFGVSYAALKLAI